MTKTELFPMYQALIRARAWKFAKDYQADYQELEAEGYLIFCEAVETFQPEKALFSTHLYTKLYKLKDICQKQKRLAQLHLRLVGESSEEDSGVLSEEVLGKLDTTQIDANKPVLEEVLAHLSSDAKLVLEGIFCEALTESGSRGIPSKAGATRILGELGWSKRKTEACWAELKQVWNQYYIQATEEAPCRAY
jgi:hypothetical protein